MMSEKFLRRNISLSLGTSTPDSQNNCTRFINRCLHLHIIDMTLHGFTIVNVQTTWFSLWFPTTRGRPIKDRTIRWYKMSGLISRILWKKLPGLISSIILVSVVPHQVSHKPISPTSTARRPNCSIHYGGLLLLLNLIGGNLSLPLSSCAQNISSLLNSNSIFVSQEL